MAKKQSLDTQSNGEFRRIFIFVSSVILISVAPFLGAKILTKYQAKPKELETKERNIIKNNASDIEVIIEQYINHHKADILKKIAETYFEEKNNKNISEQISNGIWLNDKLLFDEKLPSFKGKEAEIDVAVFFSDFKMMKDILMDITSFGEQSKMNFYFRHISSMTKYSSVIARYGYAIYQIDQKSYIPFYLSILSVPKDERTQEKCNEIIEKFGLKIDDVKQIADSKESEDIVLKGKELAISLSINQLPAFVLQNGSVFYGKSGFNVIKNIQNNEIQTH